MAVSGRVSDIWEVDITIFTKQCFSWLSRHEYLLSLMQCFESFFPFPFSLTINHLADQSRLTGKRHRPIFWPIRTRKKWEEAWDCSVVNSEPYLYNGFDTQMNFYKRCLSQLLLWIQNSDNGDWRKMMQRNRLPHKFRWLQLLNW